MKTETTREMSVRRVLRIIRKDMEGVSYISGGGPQVYACDQGDLCVCNAPAQPDGVLLGVFVAELIGARGEVVRRYKV